MARLGFQRNFASRSPGKRGLALALTTLLAITLLGASCVFLRISRWADIQAYMGMAAECHPVWKEFAFRRYSAGDSAQELFRRFPPTRREEFGRYGVYSFSTAPSNTIPFTKLAVVTRDGKLLTACAASCTWEFTFFSIQDPELDREYTAFVEAGHRKLMQGILNRLEPKLHSFYDEHNRWPTNEAEFGWFVTGQKPTPAAFAPRDDSIQARYGLTKAGREMFSRNPLGITLQRRTDGAINMGLVSESNLVLTVEP